MKLQRHLRQLEKANILGLHTVTRIAVVAVVVVAVVGRNLPGGNVLVKMKRRPKTRKTPVTTTTTSMVSTGQPCAPSY